MADHRRSNDGAFTMPGQSALSPPLTPRSGLRAGEEWELTVYGSIALILTLVFVVDVYTPLGFAAWIFYIVPVVLTMFTWRPLAAPATSLVVTIFMFVGYHLSPSAPVPQLASVAAINRSCGVFTVRLMAAIGYFFILNRIAVRRQNWFQCGQTDRNKVLRGEQSLTDLSHHLLQFLSEYLDVHVGVFFCRNDNEFHRFGTYGITEVNGVSRGFKSGEGLPGQTARNGRSIVIDDVPEGHLTIGSALHRGAPRQLLIVPVALDNTVSSVIELGLVHPLHSGVTEFLERVSDSIAVAVRSARYRTHLQELLEETQRQSEELQAQAQPCEGV